MLAYACRAKVAHTAEIAETNLVRPERSAADQPVVLRRAAAADPQDQRRTRGDSPGDRIDGAFQSPLAAAELGRGRRGSSISTSPRDPSSRFLKFSLDAAGRPIERWRRVVMYQTWRAVTDPPQDNLLALCDRRSVPSVRRGVLRRDHRREGHARWRAWRRAAAATAPIIAGGTPRTWGRRICSCSSATTPRTPEAVQPLSTGFDVPGQENATPRGSLEARFFAFLRLRTDMSCSPRRC